MNLNRYKNLKSIVLEKRKEGKKDQEDRYGDKGLIWFRGDLGQTEKTKTLSELFDQ